MWDQGGLVWDVGHRMWDVHCKYVQHVRCFPLLVAYVLLMPGVWVKNDVEGADWGNVSAPGIFCDPCPTGGLLLLICWATLYGFAP